MVQETQKGVAKIYGHVSGGYEFTDLELRVHHQLPRQSTSGRSHPAPLSLKRVLTS